MVLFFIFNRRIENSFVFFCFPSGMWLACPPGLTCEGPSVVCTYCWPMVSALSGKYAPWLHHQCPISLQYCLEGVFLSNHFYSNVCSCKTDCLHLVSILSVGPWWIVFPQSIAIIWDLELEMIGSVALQVIKPAISEELQCRISIHSNGAEKELAQYLDSEQLQTIFHAVPDSSNDRSQ